MTDKMNFYDASDICEKRLGGSHIKTKDDTIIGMTNRFANDQVSYLRMLHLGMAQTSKLEQFFGLVLTHPHTLKFEHKEK